MALSFDATYYLNQRPDVFQAYVATAGKTGLTWEQFAQNHYNSNGRFEGSNPNATFNTLDYLAANPDVAKAGINPFNHYLTSGAAEGRAPSASFISFASFSTTYAASYLAANPDLAKAGITTAQQAYAHFVVFGEFENRAGGPTVDTGIVGKSFVLTTGVDLLTGTANNDTFVADNTLAAKQLTAADSINGGAGNDTLKIFVAATDAVDATTFGTLSNVENISINNGILTTTKTLDVSGLAGVTSIALDSPVAMANNDAFTLKTTAAEAVSLTNVKGTAGGATSTLTLNGATSVTANGVNTDVTLDLSSTGTALSIKGTGAASTFALTNTGGNLATLTLSGDKAMTITDSIATLKTVNASTTTAGVTIDQSAIAADNALAFTGGTGNDTIIFKAGFLTALDVLDGGAGTDVLRINDTTPGYAAINAVKNFETLSLGTTGATVDVSQLTTIKGLSVDNAGSTAFTNSSNTHAYTINDSVDVTAVSIANATGQGTVNVTLNNTDTTSNGGLGAVHTLGTLTLTGASTVNLVSSNGGLVGDTHFITTLANSDNTNFVITGNAGLNIGLATGTAVGSSVDASALTGVLNVTGSGFNDIIKGGTAADVINGAAGADTLTGNAGNDIFAFTSSAQTKGALFAASDTSAANIDKITDFVGNGAAAGDGIQLGTTLAAFGAGVTFTGATTTTVTAVTVATAADFTALAAAVQTASAGVATTSGAAQIYDVTVTGGNLAGHYAIVNDATNTITTADAFISITGAGALHASDFTYA